MGVCTLVICKPIIRRKAAIGDWIVATGSKDSSQGNIETKVVYAMKVTAKMTMADYDKWAQSKCPNKLPDWNHSDHRRRLGDALYDYSSGAAVQRSGVHNKANYDNDLNGISALISEHFYYFGNNPVDLPPELHPIIKDSRGHKSDYNDAYVEAFVSWIENLGYILNSLNGKPQVDLFSQDTSFKDSCVVRLKCAQEDDDDD